MREEDLVEDPDRVIVSTVEEFFEGFGIVGIDNSVVNEVFPRILGVVRPCVLW